MYFTIDITRGAVGIKFGSLLSDGCLGCHPIIIVFLWEKRKFDVTLLEVVKNELKKRFGCILAEPGWKRHCFVSTGYAVLLETVAVMIEDAFECVNEAVIVEEL